MRAKYVMEVAENCDESFKQVFGAAGAAAARKIRVSEAAAPARRQGPTERFSAGIVWCCAREEASLRSEQLQSWKRFSPAGMATGIRFCFTGKGQVA